MIVTVFETGERVSVEVDDDSKSGLQLSEIVCHVLGLTRRNHVLLIGEPLTQVQSWISYSALNEQEIIVLSGEHSNIEVNTERNPSILHQVSVSSSDKLEESYDAYYHHMENLFHTLKMQKEVFFRVVQYLRTVYRDHHSQLQREQDRVFKVQSSLRHSLEQFPKSLMVLKTIPLDPALHCNKEGKTLLDSLPSKEFDIWIQRARESYDMVDKLAYNVVDSFCATDRMVSDIESRAIHVDDNIRGLQNNFIQRMKSEVDSLIRATTSQENGDRKVEDEDHAAILDERCKVIAHLGSTIWQQIDRIRRNLMDLMNSLWLIKSTIERRAEAGAKTLSRLANGNNKHFHCFEVVEKLPETYDKFLEEIEIRDAYEKQFEEAVIAAQQHLYSLRNKEIRRRQNYISTFGALLPPFFFQAVPSLRSKPKMDKRETFPPISRMGVWKESREYEQAQSESISHSQSENGVMFPALTAGNDDLSDTKELEYGEYCSRMDSSISSKITSMGKAKLIVEDIMKKEGLSAQDLLGGLLQSCPCLLTRDNALRDSLQSHSNIDFSDDFGPTQTNSPPGRTMTPLTDGHSAETKSSDILEEAQVLCEEAQIEDFSGGSESTDEIVDDFSIEGELQHTDEFREPNMALDDSDEKEECIAGTNQSRAPPLSSPDSSRYEPQEQDSNGEFPYDRSVSVIETSDVREADDEEFRTFTLQEVAIIWNIFTEGLFLLVDEGLLPITLPNNCRSTTRSEDWVVDASSFEHLQRLLDHVQDNLVNINSLIRLGVHEDDYDEIFSDIVTEAYEEHLPVIYWNETYFIPRKWSEVMRALCNKIIDSPVPLSSLVTEWGISIQNLYALVNAGLLQCTPPDDCSFEEADLVRDTDCVSGSCRVSDRWTVPRCKKRVYLNGVINGLVNLQQLSDTLKLDGNVSSVVKFLCEGTNVDSIVRIRIGDNEYALRSVVNFILGNWKLVSLKFIMGAAAEERPIEEVLSQLESENRFQLIQWESDTYMLLSDMDQVLDYLKS